MSDKGGKNDPQKKKNTEHQVFDPHCKEYTDAVPKRLHVCIKCLVEEHRRADEKRRRDRAQSTTHRVVGGYAIQPRSIPGAS